MSPMELLWRLNQYFTHIYELLVYYLKRKDVCSIKYGKQKNININNLKISINDDYLSTSYEPELIAGFSYHNNKNNWTYGFNANTNWPTIPSYILKYKNRDDIGDARINWQLNRHHQFTILAKNYYLTKNDKYLNELVLLLDDYNSKNPFLFGISWTNVMEIAIRCINWIYTYYFIYKTDQHNIILKKLESGINNMSNYVYRHISKYSSANNHRVIELCCVLMTAILSNNNDLSNSIFTKLSYELKHQTHNDGVNKEQSLHYQTFFLEAMCLSAILLKKNNYNIDCWKSSVNNISRYIIDCLDESGQAIEFGDNDEGFIIRLGKETNYYKYVVNMACKIFNIPYSVYYSSETLAILLGQKDYVQNYRYKKISSYKDGGITLIRNNKLLIGIDHGPLGFNPLAAHGHADSLSFQIIINGEKLLIDPGTYIYHINRNKRDYYRSTINHNTVCINNSNQSEIQGAFLWGKKAKTELLSIDSDNSTISLLAKHDGYNKPVYRKFNYNNEILTIYDEIGNRNGIANFNFGPKCLLSIYNNTVNIKLNDKIYTITFMGNSLNINKKSKTFSPQYGLEYNINAIEVCFKNTLTTIINLKDKIYE